MLPGTKIIMKMGKNIGRVKALIREAGMEARMVENCGMDNEKICGICQIKKTLAISDKNIYNVKITMGRKRWLCYGR